MTVLDFILFAVAGVCFLVVLAIKLWAARITRIINVSSHPDKYIVRDAWLRKRSQIEPFFTALVYSIAVIAGIWVTYRVIYSFF
jgi:hypothetical protein